MPNAVRHAGSGSDWKEETSEWYDHFADIFGSGSVMPNRSKFLDLDRPEHRFGKPQLRRTFDLKTPRARFPHTAKIKNIALPMSRTHLPAATVRNPWNAVAEEAVLKTLALT